MPYPCATRTGRDELTDGGADPKLEVVSDCLTASRYTRSGMEPRDLFNVLESLSLCMDVLESPCSMRALSLSTEY